ncbi:hypothetical protein E27107_90270 [Elizabethkingia anophelis]|nr:hypothetical protein E27107_90270 [Elizabethkingia anophelis]
MMIFILRGRCVVLSNVKLNLKNVAQILVADFIIAVASDFVNYKIITLFN